MRPAAARPLLLFASLTRAVLPAGVELETQEKLSLLEWLANEYKRFGCMLECVQVLCMGVCAAADAPARRALRFVTNKSQEGSQFCRGFGGIGGILRYQARGLRRNCLPASRP